MAFDADKTNESNDCIESPFKKVKTDAGTLNNFNYCEGHKMYWDSDKGKASL